MRYKRWEIGSFDRAVAIDFLHKGISPLVAVFLTSRGITDIEEARTVIGQISAEIHDPALLADMDKAVARITKAIESHEKIAIYGDYDVDGMTSCALLALWLRTKNADFETYIPGRFDEGYGLNQPALDMLKSHGVGLVVTVDCGITAIDEAIYARKLGLGLVITDHHECRAELPEADAVVDPKRPDCDYPNKALAGVGVAFKLVCALEKEGFEEMFRRYGDLVAIGTVADVMPIDGENRELIRRGLAILKENQRPGIYYLLRESNPDPGKITATTIGFYIAPRLNAAGRMGKPDLSVELLLTDDVTEAERLSAELSRLNSERRSLELEIYEKAEAMLPAAGPDGLIVLAQRGWYQGVTGIVAAKMAERYMAPVVIISIDENGTGRGSCRSFAPVKIYDALKTCEDLLYSFGGHDMAAGVTIAEENIDELRMRLTTYFRNNKYAADSGFGIDFEVEKPELLTVKNIGALEKLEPFGNGYPPPCLCIKEALITSIYPIGSGKHTRITVEKSGTSLDCIYFSVTPEDLGVGAGMLIDLAFEPQVNEFRGRNNVQLLLQDIRKSKAHDGH